MLRRRETLRAVADTVHQGQRREIVTSASRLSRMALRAGLVLLVLFTAWKWIAKAHEYIASASGKIDFSFYYDCALTLRENPQANIYDMTLVRAVATAHHAYLGNGQFQYPPLLPILVMPLTWLPFDTAVRIWLYFNLALWLVGTVLLIDLLRFALLGRETRLFRGTTTWRALASRPNAIGWIVGADDSQWTGSLFAVALAVFLSFKYGPLAQSMWLGQSSPLIFVLVLLAQWLIRRRQPELAGGVMGLAAWIKVFPGLLILYFLLRRQWRIVAGAVTAGILLLVMMISVIGVSGVLSTTHMLSNGSNQSLGYQNEALARVPMWIALWLGHRMSTGLLLAGYALCALVALAFFGGVIYQQRRRSVIRGDLASEDAHAGSTESLLGYNWALVTMVLMSPITWEHHDAWILPAIIICLGVSLRALTFGLRDARGRLKAEVWFVVAVALAYILTRSDFPYFYDTISTPDLTVQFLGHPLRPVYMVMRPIGGLLVWLVAGALFLWRSPTPDEPPDEPLGAASDEREQSVPVVSAVARSQPPSALE